MGSNIAAALALAQSKLGWIEKTGTVSAGSNSYKVLQTPHLISEVRGQLLEAGVTVSTSVDRVEDVDRVEQTKRTQNGEITQIWRTSRVWLRVVFAHAASGESLEVVHVGQASDNGPAAVAKASTIALRYALQQCLMIPAGDDPEEVESEPPRQPQQRPQQRPQQPPAKTAPISAYGAQLQNQARRINTFAGQALCSADELHTYLSQSTDGAITEADLIREADRRVDSLDLKANPYAASVRHAAIELAKLQGHPRYLCESMIGKSVKGILESTKANAPTAETAERAMELVKAELAKHAPTKAA